MREIKFRAWDSYFKSFTGFIIEKDKNNEDRIFFKKANHYSDYCLGENKTRFFLMQYTGLKDKNGVEIYEGDIVKDLRSLFKDARSYSKVFYQEDRGRFVFGGWEIPAGMSHTFEVIGNIYENPELLEFNK